MDNELKRRLIRHLEQAIRTYDGEIMALALAAPPTRIKAAQQLDEARKDAEDIVRTLRNGSWLDDANLAKLKSKL